MNMAKTQPAVTLFDGLYRENNPYKQKNWINRIASLPLRCASHSVCPAMCRIIPIKMKKTRTAAIAGTRVDGNPSRIKIGT
ncbi:hypothetical protein ACFS07_08030 [Undibacterium arcticum]